MKKIFNYSIAVIAAVAAVSCAKELEIEQTGNVSGQENKIVFSLPASKTALDEGKTVWVAGDKILITDGTTQETLTVPEASAGEKSVELTTALSGKLYAIYPVEAAASTPVVEGQVSLVVPGNQDGTFASANICAAVSENYQMAMRNVTAVVSVYAAIGVDGLVFSAPGDALSGSFTVDLSGSDPVITKKSTTGVISVDAAGGDNTYYVAVIPGTYKAGFSLTAVNLDGEFETKTTTAEKSLAVNQLADMGEIGDEMNGLAGDGSEGDPFQINNLAELTAFAYSVNLGNTYEGQFLKVIYDIPGGLTTPAGGYTTEDLYFKGNFDGNGKTITLAIDGANNSSPNFCALFGDVGDGANIHDVIVDGTVKGSSYTAGIAGCINSGATGVTVKNCTNKATVNGTSYVAGIIGYGDASEKNGLVVDGCINNADITGTNHYVGGVAGFLSGADVKVINCTNKSAVSGTYSIGGIAGHVYAGTIESCVNDAAAVITGTDTKSDGFYKSNQGNSGWMWGNWSTAWAGGTPYNINNCIRGIGGIAGYAQNAKFISDTNNGTVEGVDKVGGIVGGAYTANTTSCTNNGAVTASNSMAGGILGWAYTAHTANGDTNNGTITAKFCVSGLYGFLNCQGFSSSNSTSSITGAMNTGAVIATTSSRYVDSAVHNDVSMAGGVFGYLVPAGRTNTTRGLFNIQNCSNSGTVTGAGLGVGGVVGRLLSKTYGLTNTFANISNTGDVTGPTCVGGVIGDCYVTNSGHYKTNMTNISNTGNVVATLEGDASVFVGGIFGNVYILGGGGSNTYGNQVSNAFNTGEVTYASASNTKPYAGGFAGNYVHGLVYNVYNVGYVGPAGYMDPVADASLGSVFGYIGGGKAGAGYLYFDKGTAAAACGSGSIDLSNVSMVDSGGILLTPVTYDSKEYDEVLNALNAYATKNSLKSWIPGPAFGN